MGDRCTGACCKKMPLPYSPERMAWFYRAWRNQIKGAVDVNDIHLLWPMVRFTGETRDTEIEGKTETRWLYDCAHQSENGDCGIYEDRPEMCRNYPYRNKCERSECQWEAATDGRTG